MSTLSSRGGPRSRRAYVEARYRTGPSFDVLPKPIVVVLAHSPSRGALKAPKHCVSPLPRRTESQAPFIVSPR
jgi:hypothetical protein